MLCKANLVFIGAYGVIVPVLKLCHGFWPVPLENQQMNGGIPNMEYEL
jgi:hypothetical protein